MQLSVHFSLREMTFSAAAARLGIPNSPPVEALANLQRLAETMESIRRLLDQPIFIHSGYRNPEVNKLCGGVPTSDHIKGLACDFVCPGFGSPYDVARTIAASHIGYRQLIREYAWVHIAIPAVGEEADMELLTKRDAGSPYEVGINA
jgi:zinc D-Ala-D-Ala carboxypeptidase